jgi:hypothetical protein
MIIIMSGRGKYYYSKELSAAILTLMARSLVKLPRLQIDVFHGAKRIENLPPHPLDYHPDTAIKERLVASGRKSVSMIGCYYCQYRGNTFVLNENHLVKIPANGRIMIDTGLSRRSTLTMQDWKPRKRKFMVHLPTSGFIFERLC